MGSTAQHGNVHQIFAGILSGIEQQPEQLRRAQYVSRLVRMDWEFERSDDGRAHRAGRDELQALRELQADIDPDAEIWNRYAPLQYLMTRRVKVVAIKPDGERVTHWMNTGLNDTGLRMFMVEKHGNGTQVEVVQAPSNVAREVVA